LFSSSFPSIILYRRPNGRQGTVKLPIPANSASNPGDKAPPGLLPVCLLLDALILVLLALPVNDFFLTDSPLILHPCGDWLRVVTTCAELVFQ
jgi:hypothetical protein